MNNFDPWTASDEQVTEAQRAWALRYPDGHAPGCAPVFQAHFARWVIAMKAKIQAGGQDSGYCVLLAVSHVLTFDLVAPDWLAYAFNSRFDQVNNYHAGSWDDPAAFGAPIPKGTHLAALRKRRRLRFKVFLRISDIREMEPQTALDKRLFTRVGRELGLGKTLAEEYYYGVIEEQALAKRGRQTYRMGKLSPANSARFPGRVRK